MYTRFILDQRRPIEIFLIYRICEYPAWPGPKIPYLGEGFGLETASGGLKNPMPEKEMTDFEP